MALARRWIDLDLRADEEILSRLTHGLLKGLQVLLVGGGEVAAHDIFPVEFNSLRTGGVIRYTVLCHRVSP
jgi:hypothetical protein